MIGFYVIVKLLPLSSGLLQAETCTREERGAPPPPANLLCFHDTSSCPSFLVTILNLLPLCHIYPHVPTPLEQDDKEVRKKETKVAGVPLFPQLWLSGNEQD